MDLDVDNQTLTAITGIRVGHWTDPVAATGCTVVELPEPNVVTAEVRGGAPGVRETALLEPGMIVEQCQAIVLSGGSAFGLGTADGVMAELRARGRGHATEFGPIPIVPTAVVFDRGIGDPDVHPTAESGAAALRSATSDVVEQGRVGAGAGCSVGQWRGVVQRSGIGSALAHLGTVRAAALVVLNSTGDIFSLDGSALTGGPHVAAPPTRMAHSGQNTTLLVVATDKALTRSELTRVTIRAHDAMAACIRPAHTRYDGDICFAVACGSGDHDPTAVDLVAEAAFEATGRAIREAIERSRS